MKKTGICPKCNHDKIIIIKDQLHENGGGNISQITNHINKPSEVFSVFKEGNTAKKTFNICENCGYIEEYLDKEKIQKLLSYKPIGRKIQDFSNNFFGPSLIFYLDHTHSVWFSL